MKASGGAPAPQKGFRSHRGTVSQKHPALGNLALAYGLFRDTAD